MGKKGSPEDWRQIRVTESDVDFLLDLLKKAGPHHGFHGLQKQLEQLKEDFHDGLLKLRELEARVKANSFYGSPVHRGETNFQFRRAEKRRRHKEIATDLEKEEDEGEKKAARRREEGG